ncbi:MAG: DUF4412 domain-containing protein [Bacteroidota bacterium]
MEFKKQLITLCLLLCTALFGNAQQSLKEGTVEYKLIYNNLPEEMKQIQSTLPSKVTLYFKNNQFKTEMLMAQGEMSMLFDEGKKEMIMLMDMMGQKMKFKITEEQFKEKQIATFETQGIKNVEVKATQEIKTIAGYACTKHIVSYEIDGKKETSFCYVTDKLPSSSMLADNPIYAGIKGFMMEYNTSQQGMTITMVAEKVKAESISEKVFTIPDGYKEIDPAMLNGR